MSSGSRPSVADLSLSMILARKSRWCQSENRLTAARPGWDGPTVVDVLLVTVAPEIVDEPDSPARALAELGCKLAVIGFDLESDERGPAPQAIVIDARDRLESGYACLKQLRPR